MSARWSAVAGFAAALRSYKPEHSQNSHLNSPDTLHSSTNQSQSHSLLSSTSFLRYFHYSSYFLYSSLSMIITSKPVHYYLLNLLCHFPCSLFLKQFFLIFRLLGYYSHCQACSFKLTCHLLLKEYGRVFY